MNVVSGVEKESAKLGEGLSQRASTWSERKKPPDS